MKPLVRTPGLTFLRLSDFNHDTAKMLMDQMQKVLDAYGCKTVEELLSKAPQHGREPQGEQHG